MNIKRLSGKNLWIFIKSLVFGSIVTILCLAGFAYIMSSLGIGSGGSVSAMANIALCAGSFTAAYTGANIRTKDGLLTGLLIGASVYVIVYFLGAFLLKHFADISLLTKFLFVALSAGIGGIIGVNRKINPEKAASKTSWKLRLLDLSAKLFKPKTRRKRRR